MTRYIKAGRVSHVLGRIYGKLPPAKIKSVTLALDSAEASGGSTSDVVESLRGKLSRNELAQTIRALLEVYRDENGDDEFTAMFPDANRLRASTGTVNTGVPNPDGVQAGKVGGALQDGSRWSRQPASGSQAMDSAYSVRFPDAGRLLK